jgi:hypothetical protein
MVVVFYPPWILPRKTKACWRQRRKGNNGGSGGGIEEGTAAWRPENVNVREIFVVLILFNELI